MCRTVCFVSVSRNSQHCKRQSGACTFQGRNLLSSKVTAMQCVLCKDPSTEGIKGQTCRRSPGRGSQMCRTLPSLPNSITLVLALQASYAMN